MCHCEWVWVGMNVWVNKWVYVCESVRVLCESMCACEAVCMYVHEKLSLSVYVWYECVWASRFECASVCECMSVWYCVRMYMRVCMCVSRVCILCTCEYNCVLDVYMSVILCDWESVYMSLSVSMSVFWVSDRMWVYVCVYEWVCMGACWVKECMRYCEWLNWTQCVKYKGVWVRVFEYECDQCGFMCVYLHACMCLWLRVFAL